MPDTFIHNEYDETVFVALPPTSISDRSRSFGQNSLTAQQVAAAFVRDRLPQMNLDGGDTISDDDGRGFTAQNPSPHIIFAAEKAVPGAHVVIYQQRAFGLDVFDAQVGVQIDMRTMNVASAQSSAHAEITIANPAAKTESFKDSIGRKSIENALGFKLPGVTRGTCARQVIYRYEPHSREDRHLHEDAGCLHPGGADIPHLRPTTIKGLTKGQHYICDEILFRAEHVEGETAVNWRMLVEPQSGDVLYLRALVGCATGLVFQRDPQTQGGAAVTGASSNAELNPFRSLVTLPGLIPSTPQELKGEFVEVVDISEPVIVPPSASGPAGKFDFDVRTDEFSAVNAYYNCDRLFRTMQDFGFDVASYFDGTTFPVPVDHRGKGSQLNADAPGTQAGTGLGMMRYGLILPPNEVGIVTSNRVVWHEFGHALLWDHVSSPNFGFAHSAGDALAVILNDPGSLEADRFDTFPWVQQGANLGRRHDRAVSDGWGWFGPNYNTQYNGEQILSTTLFRFYRAIGGDSDFLPTKVCASEASAFLIFKAIGLLVSTTPFPEIFVQTLQTADLTTTDFRDVPGGALHKVLRWAFEKQGLFQTDAVPGQGNQVNREGNPPDVDVYIDDGRDGEYEYRASHWNCQDIWVRHSADGRTEHQRPRAGQTNYIYVRVKNRGMQNAENVSVQVFCSAVGVGSSYPEDWAPVATPALVAADPIAPGGQTVLGPFSFTPDEAGSDLLAIASADGDPGNDATINGSIAEHRFVPFDNNIALRSLSPVMAEPDPLVRWFDGRSILIRNPFRETRLAEIIITLPRFMEDTGWQLKLVSEGGHSFELGPRERRSIVLELVPGSSFERAEAESAIANGDSLIEVTALLDGEAIGGTGFPLSLDSALADGPNPSESEKLIIERPTAEDVLEAMEGRSVRSVTLEFDTSGDTGSPTP